MVTVQQILEQNSADDNIFIATYHRAQFERLMSLLESQGYKWCSGINPTEYTTVNPEILETLEEVDLRDNSIILTLLHCANKTISYDILSPAADSIGVFTFYFDNYNNCDKIIKPFLALEKRLKEASDYANN